MQAAGELPNRIRELRKARGLYLEQLADMIGCSVTFMSDLERGVRDLGHVWMVRIAKALRVEVADLLLREDGISAEELLMLDLFRTASAEQRRLILEIVAVIVPNKSYPKRAITQR